MFDYLSWNRDTERDRDGQTDRERERDGQTDKQTDRQTDRVSCGLSDANVSPNNKILNHSKIKPFEENNASDWMFGSFDKICLRNCKIGSKKEKILFISIFIIFLFFFK